MRIGTMVKSLALVALMALVCARPASAQGDSKLYVGADISHIEISGIGAGGAIVKQLQPMGPGMLHLVFGGALVRADGINVVGAGGGVRMTFTPNGKITPFAEAIVGLVHLAGQNAFGIAPGGGIIYAYSDKMDIVAGASLGTINYFGARVGIRGFVGVQIPLN